MTLHAADLTSRLAIDAQGVDSLRAQAKHDPDQALKTAARQFEALFMNMLLKSMREASPQDGPFDNEQTRLYTSLLDQQLVQTLSARGIGLADIMVRQLAKSGLAIPAAEEQGPEAPGGVRTPAAGPGDAPGGAGAAPAAGEAPLLRNGNARMPDAAREFMDRHASAAEAAGAATGIPARFLLAQAALESGWGRREIRGADGAESHNLFGIKAGRNWSGPVVEAVTTEYVDGKAVKSVERFRAYRSHAESFRDYASLIANSPRYAGVRDRQDEVAFAYGLQRAGYATDPKYADKLLRVIDGIKARFSATA